MTEGAGTEFATARETATVAVGIETGVALAQETGTWIGVAVIAPARETAVETLTGTDVALARETVAMTVALKEMETVAALAPETVANVLG